MKALFLTGYGLAVRVRDTRLVFKQGINDPFGRENIEFGASRHTASAIIRYMRVNPSIRSVTNIRFNDELVKICKNLFSVSSYDRSKEPTGIKKKEGSSVTWGTLQALSQRTRERTSSFTIKATLARSP